MCTIFGYGSLYTMGPKREILQCAFRAMQLPCTAVEFLLIQSAEKYLHCVMLKRFRPTRHDKITVTTTKRVQTITRHWIVHYSTLDSNITKEALKY